MLIYAEQITPRLRYIAEVFFGECNFTSSPVEFYEANVPKINYSYKKFSEDEFHIRPYGLLSEATIKKYSPGIFQWDGLQVFFPSPGDIPFDIFSASFFLLSRYEEYLPHKKDSYGRFAHTESLACKEGFLDKPLVNLWMQSFQRLIKAKFPAYQPAMSEFRFIPTYDIDIAFAGGSGLLGEMIKLLRGRKTRINGKDIFDVYDWLDELHLYHRLSPIFFFLLAKHRGKYDKNLSPKSKQLQQLVKKISARYETGIHPSWQSYHDENALRDEINVLAKISRKTITASRQHYIQFALPHTYRELVHAGISDDYSMGYGSINGFRASYAAPFHWYDLMKEEKTSLLLHPFCYMEANSFFEQKLSAGEAVNELQHYYDVVRSVNGELITIFHNHFITEEAEWKPWREMYAAFLVKNFKRENITSLSLQE
jgi:hypothetical protein